MKFKLTDGRDVTLPSDPAGAARFFADTIRNGGYTPDGEGQIRWEDMHKLMTDAVTSTEVRTFMETSMEMVIREPVEPLMQIHGLYNKVSIKGGSTQILMGALGAVHAGDVQENGTYPEVMFQVGGAVQTAWIGKTGIAAAFTDEALRYSTWDIMAMNLRLMRNAMLRLKEQKAVAFLRKLGTTLFDNATPADSFFGVCTGRGLDMEANGSMNMDDLFKSVSHMTEEGFAPDTLLMSPLFFYMGIQDPVLRNLYMMGAQGGAYFRPWAGQAGPQDPWSNGQMGAQGPSLGNRIVPGGSVSGESATGISGREHGMTAAAPIPTPYFPWNLRVIVSPLVPFDPDTQLGDIYLLSSGNVGFHLVDEEITQVEWREESTELRKVKLRERYGFAVAHEGQGVGVMKNVKLARNYWDGTVTAQTQLVDGEIPADVATV